MFLGKIRIWHDGRGFGFVGIDDGRSIFCHISDVMPRDVIPRRGDRVSLEMRETDRGPRAYNVQLLVEP